jgi:hypothetical protein
MIKPRQGSQSDILFNELSDRDIVDSIFANEQWFGCSRLYIRGGRLESNKVPILRVVRLDEALQVLAAKHKLASAFDMMHDDNLMVAIVTRFRMAGHTPFTGWRFKHNTITPAKPYRVEPGRCWLVPTEDHRR